MIRKLNIENGKIVNPLILGFDFKINAFVSNEKLKDKRKRPIQKIIITLVSPEFEMPLCINLLDKETKEVRVNLGLDLGNALK